MILKFISILFFSSFPFFFSLNGDFVFDDSEAIFKNKDVISEFWLDSFKNDFWGTNIKSNLSHKSYRPLTILTFRLNYFLNSKQLSAKQFKASNLLCHVLCCLLVWRTYDNIWKRVEIQNREEDCTDVPFLSALLFSVHPVHVESVCGIVGRADLLAGITFFLSFLIYDHCIKEQFYKTIALIISILLAGISMLFKENGITVLGICCVYDITINFKMKKSSTTCNKSFLNNIEIDKKCLKRILYIIISAIFFLYARWIIMGSSKPVFKSTDNPTAFSNNIFTKVATYNYIYFLNILLLIWPQWLCYDWSMNCIPLITNVLDFRILFSTLIYIFAMLFIILIRNQKNRNCSKRLIISAISLSVIPFMPASNIVFPVGFVIAERILYIPSVGYCFLVCIGLNKLTKNKMKRKQAMLTIFYCLIILYAARSYKRAFDWQNEYQLFTKALTVCPLNAKVHYNVAKVADAKQNTSWALTEYEEAIRLYPEYYQAMNNLANLLKNQKEYARAETLLRNAIYFKQDFPAAWMNLGIILAHTGRYDESENAYKTALRYRKNYPDCYYNLGNLYLEINKSEDAMTSWFQAINLNPKHISAWTNLLALLDNTGQLDKALQIIPKALDVLPGTASVNFAIANIYGKIEQYSEAEKHFLKTIEILGNRAQAIHFANLGVLYHRWKKYELAMKTYKRALEVDPKFPSAIKNLKSLKKHINIV